MGFSVLHLGHISGFNKRFLTHSCNLPYPTLSPFHCGFKDPSFDKLFLFNFNIILLYHGKKGHAIQQCPYVTALSPFCYSHTDEAVVFWNPLLVDDTGNSLRTVIGEQSMPCIVVCLPYDRNIFGFIRTTPASRRSVMS